MGKLYFNYSTMNAGKSTALLQAAYNYEERGMAVLLLTAACDDRSGRGRIASRVGLARNAEVFDASMICMNESEQQEATRTPTTPCRAF